MANGGWKEFLQRYLEDTASEQIQAIHRLILVKHFDGIISESDLQSLTRIQGGLDRVHGTHPYVGIDGCPVDQEQMEADLAVDHLALHQLKTQLLKQYPELKEDLDWCLSKFTSNSAQR